MYLRWQQQVSLSCCRLAGREVLVVGLERIQMARQLEGHNATRMDNKNGMFYIVVSPDGPAFILQAVTFEQQQRDGLLPSTLVVQQLEVLPVRVTARQECETSVLTECFQTCVSELTMSRALFIAYSGSVYAK